MKKTRELTVHTKFRERRCDTIIVPEIRLMGRWLQKVGFKQGQIIKVEMHKGKLIISPENTVDPT